MKKNKAIIFFLLKFFISYFLMFGIYTVYLHKNQKKGAVFSCAPITQTVARHASSMANFFGLDSYTEQNTSELSMKFYLNDKYTVKVVEGCSSISVIILFLAFIIAFKGDIKDTILFGIAGSVFIYLTNLARIIILTVLIQKFPKYQYFLHELMFPAIIYGMVFLLWIIWVKFFSHHNKLKVNV